MKIKKLNLKRFGLLAFGLLASTTVSLASPDPALAVARTFTSINGNFYDPVNWDGGIAIPADTDSASNSVTGTVMNFTNCGTTPDMISITINNGASMIVSNCQFATADIGNTILTGTNTWLILMNGTTYQSPIDAANGTIINFQSPLANGIINGPIILRDGSALYIDQPRADGTFTSSTVTIPSGTATVKILVDTAAFNTLGAGTLSVNRIGSSLFYSNPQATGNYTYADSKPTWDLNINNTQTVTLNGTRNIARVTSGTLTVNGTVGTTTVSGTSNLTVNGTAGATTVSGTGTLKGTGTVGSLSVTSPARLAPGLSPGCITAGNTTLTGGFDVELGGTTACTEYDQLIINGTINITGSTLNLSRWNNFTPAMGQTYTIINNDSTDAVTGTFLGLAEGVWFSLNGYTFSISYVGGDGNDVVLTVVGVAPGAPTSAPQSVPGVPNTGFQLLSANPIATLVASLGAIASLYALVRLRQLKR